MDRKTKIVAFYLPQFHAIPENDEWWGKGFTEWTNVRKAVPHHKGQYQPRVPLNNNYYDLSDIKTLKWQADLANKYGVYGFCLYHYWFGGKLLLEKPAQNLLAHPEIGLNYCFSWANEPWARTWDGKNKQVLMPQSYGGKEEWKLHFDYLLPFFKDDRYIKEEGKPMFLIYKSASINQCQEMMEYWQELAKQSGLPGVHFVETLKKWLPEKRELSFAAKVEFEPTGAKNISQLYYHRIRRYLIRGINSLFKLQLPENKKILFKNEVKKSLQNLSPKGTYPGVFIGWDNTARRGLSAIYITSPTKQEFKNYLTEKIDIGKRIYQTDYLFINAWNEWAEGTYLEPDEKHGYEYLEAIKEVLDKKQ